MRGPKRPRLHSMPIPDSILLGWTEKRPPKRQIGFFKDVKYRVQKRPIWYSGHHLATIAATGAGKAVSAAIPTLLSYPGSIVALDTKGELYDTTHRYRKEMGQQVIVLRPFAGSDQPSDRFNFTDVRHCPNFDVETDSQVLASLLATDKGFSKDPFWSITGTSLIAGMLTYIFALEAPEKCNFARLVEMLYGRDVAYDVAVRLDTQESRIPKFAYQQFASFLNMPERETRPSVLATSQSFVAPLIAPRVMAAMGESSFSIQDFRNGKPMTIYLVIPPDRMVSHASLILLWVGTLLKIIFSRTTIPRLRTLLLIDETAALGKFPLLQTAITLCRSFGGRVWTFWQSLQQIQACYPDSWRTLIDNSSLQVFGIRSKLMARELAEVIDIDAHSLMHMSAEEQFLQLEGHNSLVCRKINYLKDRIFAGRFDPNPYYAEKMSKQPLNVGRCGRKS
ncbi:type IV secretory system conjugative DNA transfer family protein [Blastopirellula sp. JC732]|uniref:Type IV secretory system conjugative DNA transfer family protein n=1 Tax=Blastopirellula sediminis TaxID=2894196 RepID=A0A9X1SEU7_9BACT|nr:type IV secretory system conjugative DNA transfer family protein [Blastopirellula sediminis]MCC9608105.1 type IV secretory system conjugative DNA transfer family protein [Blastopirellula sediminis]MCC9627102.1 type IV secretory system conjugative DNA transfer family protein [Blastopirellula sediminis]